MIQTLLFYLPKKPKFCVECIHWKGRCAIGYYTKAHSKACRQALPIMDITARGNLWELHLE